MILGADLHRYEKPRRPPGLDPRTVQPVASRYNDYVIPAHFTDNITTNYCEGYRSDISSPPRVVTSKVVLPCQMTWSLQTVQLLLCQNLYKKVNSVFLSSTLMSEVGRQGTGKV
jgi:hypothetical protein